jgi:HAD superfamily hydrolase (TIGR01549 family)|tara:strand:- start:1165 stop:1851 length:687 start_codon:yes stop_codon:yes gene_type:complete
MKTYSVITFDLDNTLWPVEPSIIHAENELYNWLEIHYSKLTNQFSKEDIQVFREPILEQYKDMLHDLTFVRTALLIKLAESVGYPESMASEAMIVYRKARNVVSFYPDTMPAIEELEKHFTLAAITNGNAEIEKMDIGQFFKKSFYSADIGVAKPHPAIFKSAIDYLGVESREIIHIGDDPINDVIGAHKAGMDTIWLNRNDEVWPKGLSEPTYTVNNLSEVTDLLVY